MDYNDRVKGNAEVTIQFSKKRCNDCRFFTEKTNNSWGDCTPHYKCLLFGDDIRDYERVSKCVETFPTPAHPCSICKINEYTEQIVIKPGEFRPLNICRECMDKLPWRKHES